MNGWMMMVVVGARLREAFKNKNDETNGIFHMLASLSGNFKKKVDKSLKSCNKLS